MTACPECARPLSMKSQRLGKCQRADCGVELERIESGDAGA